MAKKRVRITDTQPPKKPVKKVGRKVAKSRGESRKARHKAKRLERSKALTQPVVNAKTITELGKAIDAITNMTELPLLGGDVKRIRDLLLGIGVTGKSRQKMTTMDKAEAENVAIWVRRVLVADLWAQGKNRREIAQQFNMSQKNVFNDLRALSQWQLLSGTVEQASVTVLKTLNRMEQLQKNAFNDLLVLPEEAYVSRSELRKEIEGRETKTLEIVRALGFLKSIEGKVDEPDPGAKGPNVQVNVNIGAPEPEKPYEEMGMGELMDHMEQYTTHIRNHRLSSEIKDAEYTEIDEKTKGEA